MGNSQELKTPRNIVGVGSHVLLGTATGTVLGIVTGKYDNKKHIYMHQGPGVVVSGWGWHLFPGNYSPSRKWCSKRSPSFIVDEEQLHLHMGGTIFP